MLFSNYLAGGGSGAVMLMPLYRFHQMLLRSQRSSRSAPLLLPSEVIISRRVFASKLLIGPPSAPIICSNPTFKLVFSPLNSTQTSFP